VNATLPSDSPWALPPAVVATRPHRLPTGRTVQLWAPATEGAHPAGWYRPAVELCATFATSTVWRLAIGDLCYLGRVDRPGSPSLWLYRHRGGGEVLVDVHGRPWALVDDDRRRAGYRLEPADLATAAADLDLPTSAGDARTQVHADGDAVVLPFRRP
jgi:hypothetical protein